MFMFLFIINIIISLSFSSNLVYIEEDINDNKVLTRNLGEIKHTKAFYCVNPADEKVYNETYHKCHLFNTNCTQYSDSTKMYPCVCKKEYATKEGDAIYCEYKRKRQLVAFLLELFVGFGAGHFYRGNNLMGALKLCAFLFGIYIICLFPLTLKCFDSCCENDCCVVVVSIFFFLCSAGLAFWFVFDLTKWGKNKYLDKNGIELLHW